MNQTQFNTLNENLKDTIELPASRWTALQDGVTKYFTGRACKYGHTTYRYTASGQCAACASIKAKKKWHAGIRQDGTNRPETNKRWNRGKKGQEAKQRWKINNPKRAWAVFATGGAKSRANLYGLEFNLSSKYVLSITPDTCPVFDTPFIFMGNNRITPESASLDRLNPAKGYVPGNVVVISMKANVIKNAYGSVDIFKVAKWLEEKGL